ncbi:MAG: hypothetical protein PWQ77_427 [Kosmotogales bacterium]|nr:hypothetical protein [Kosmotogales bacterium]
MKFCKIEYNDKAHWGSVKENKVYIIDKKPWQKWKETGEIISKEDGRLLCPVDPKNIIGIGKNYKSNFKSGETFPSEPFLFLKGLGALAASGDLIKIPSYSKKVFIEGELVIIIGKRCKNIQPGDSMNYIFGYTCSNDITAVDMLGKSKKWVEAKSADDFLPIGPVINTEIKSDASLKTTLDGEIVQKTTIDQLVFGIAELVSYCSKIMTLNPGDIITSGSPAGKQVCNGSTVCISIEGIGTLKNEFVGE